MKPGAPRGNRNAVKHGFYARVLSAANQIAIEEAAGCEGLDDEIAVLRWKIRVLLEKDPDNLELHLNAINTLAKLLKARYELSAEQKTSLRDAIFKVLTEVAIPLGIKLIPGMPR